MKVEIYQAETNKICRLHQAILDGAYDRMINKDPFSPLEQQGLLHSLQVLVENSIGKAKHVLKHYQCEIPVSAYDSFDALQSAHLISSNDLKMWHKIVGFRNTVVHEYMNVDFELVHHIVEKKEYMFICRFLYCPFEDFGNAI